MITYDDLEPISSEISAQAITLNYLGGSETLTISDAGVAGKTVVDSTLGESLTLTHAFESLEINAGSGNDRGSVRWLAATSTRGHPSPLAKLSGRIRCGWKWSLAALGTSG